MSDTSSCAGFGRAAKEVPWQRIVDAGRLHRTPRCRASGGGARARLQGNAGGSGGVGQRGRSLNGRAKRSPLSAAVCPPGRLCDTLGMQTVASKQRILAALNDLGEDASVEEAIERLYQLAKVEKGLAQLDTGQSVDHDEVKRRLGL